MSQEYVELAQSLHEAFNRDGWEALWCAADPEIEFHEPPEQPGASVFRGLEAARAGVSRSWDENWIRQWSVAERFVDLGERVLMLATQHLLGRDGVEVAQPIGSIATFRAGRVIRFEAYWDQASALKAAGLEE